MADLQSPKTTTTADVNLQSPKVSISDSSMTSPRRSSSVVRSNVLGSRSDAPENGFLDTSFNSNNADIPFLDKYNSISSPISRDQTLLGQPATKYDASGTMNRLRMSLVGSERRDRTNDNYAASRSYTTTTMDTTDSGSLSTTNHGLHEDEIDDLLPNEKIKSTGYTKLPPKIPQSLKCRWEAIFGQIPAIALVSMFHLMIGIPFGVSYFPISWGHADTTDLDGSTDFNGTATSVGVGHDLDSSGSGPFPLPGKEAFGIRMFLFSTMLGQIVFTLMSGFPNAIGLQMVENVPFCQELSRIAIAHQGWGIDALSTIIVMFGLASIVVGTVFYLLGRFQLGRVVYFFPTHVLVGCIGGIGLFICRTGLEVTIADELNVQSVLHNWHLLRVVLAFEVILRAVEKMSQGAYPLLTPIYFCMIPPVFYCILAIMGYSIKEAEDAGYFFPRLDSSEEETDAVTSGNGIAPTFLSTVLNDPHLFDMWSVINLPRVSWHAIWDAVPTLIALTLFSLIHVPISKLTICIATFPSCLHFSHLSFVSAYFIFYSVCCYEDIPAFALSTNRDVDMNNELMAHGYANFFAGMVGSLQCYLAYTQSVLYYKSGGTGRISGLVVAAMTAILYFVGPAIASLVPRCMAGTLLLHVGLDLFLEGVYDSYAKFDRLEYAGVWLIVVVMVVFGMEGAMVAGMIAAVSTYAVQSITYLNPIRGFMSAATLRSSRRDRPPAADIILDSPIVGRNRILVIQLQGHLFFGNIAQLTKSLHMLLTDEDNEEARSSNHEMSTSGKEIPEFDEWLPPLIIIMDFSLVVSIDSSAAHAIGKLKNSILKKYPCELCLSVTPSEEGFPTAFDLSSELSKRPVMDCDSGGTGKAVAKTDKPINEATELLQTCLQQGDARSLQEKYSGSYVLHSLDEALIFAENAIIAREDCALVTDSIDDGSRHPMMHSSAKLQAEEEREVVRRSLTNLCPQIDIEGFEHLFSLMEREVYTKDEYLWRQDSQSDSAKVLVSGSLIARLEHEAGTTEGVRRGNVIGELGLVNGDRRMSSVQCISDEAVLYSLSRASYEDLVRTSPTVARYIDLICIKYLAHRVQHVSNRIFETRCLPI